MLITPRAQRVNIYITNFGNEGVCKNLRFWSTVMYFPIIVMLTVKISNVQRVMVLGFALL